MGAGAARLRRTDRLGNSKDFQRIRREGARRVSSHFVVVVGRHRREGVGEGPILGVTVSKRIGSAVHRNRVKRRIREWFRQNRALIAKDACLVVIARRGAAELSSAESGRELGSLFE